MIHMANGSDIAKINSLLQLSHGLADAKTVITRESFDHKRQRDSLLIRKKIQKYKDLHTIGYW